MRKDIKSLFGTHHGLDARSMDFLTKAIEKNNLPGFDYVEYKQSLMVLRDMDMEEETAFKSAYATASTMGLTKEKLLKTADHYRKVLAKEKQQFEAAVEKQVQQRVQSKVTEVDKLKKQIEDYKAKIAQLEEKIAQSQKTIDNADREIQASKEKIDTARENFELTLQSILNEIDQDVANIEKYLK